MPPNYTARQVVAACMHAMPEATNILGAALGEPCTSEHDTSASSFQTIDLRCRVPSLFAIEEYQVALAKASSLIFQSARDCEYSGQPMLNDTSAYSESP